ncbi:hypothetical protein [Okeania hirsuta]|uniref:hypothetical protein n=1 Tax=Okeania hirsuta TaxID=1458930 RepID=UPI000F53DA2E|nr:hypothetical protein [Okeania hirsuta]
MKFKLQKSALVKRVYDINRALLRSQPTPNPSQEGKSVEVPQEGRKNQKPRVEGESFLVA